MTQESMWQYAKEEPPQMDSAVDFPSKTRFHIALNVKHVEGLIPFYQMLFGQEPHTVREGYAKFDLREPPLNLSLNEVPKNAKGNGYFGIQVKAEDVLEETIGRLEASGFQRAGNAPGANDPRGTLAITDPEGNRWELFTRGGTGSLN